MTRGETIEELIEKIGLYRAALEAHGHDPMKGRVTLMVHTFVGDDLQSTIEQARQPFIKYMRSHISLLIPLLKSLDISTDGVSEADLENVAGFAFERYARTASLIGTPDSLFNLVQRLENAGVNELACLIDWMDCEAAFSGLSKLQDLRKLVSTSLPSNRVLNAHCSAALPHYMVPSAFMFLDKLPTTPNGKVDRKALPTIESTSQENVYQLPRTDTERTLGAIWQDILGVSRVSVFDSFFQLGGNSLVAMRILAKIHQTYKIQVPLGLIFSNPTVSAMADYIDADRLGGNIVSDPEEALTEQGIL